MAANIVKPALTAERLRDRLRYEPETGEFYWRDSCQGTLAGDRAGTDGTEGRRHICVDYGRYKAHRLAWLYVHGIWPNGQLDHINGIPSDNRIANLREATCAQNQWNQRDAHSHNKTGLLGAQWRPDKKKFRSRIVVGGREKHLGHFDTAEEAHAVYLRAKALLHPLVEAT